MARSRFERESRWTKRLMLEQRETREDLEDETADIQQLLRVLSIPDNHADF